MPKTKSSPETPAEIQPTAVSEPQPEPMVHRAEWFKKTGLLFGLVILGVVLLLGLWLLARITGSSANDKPNVILIMTDDLDFKVLEHMPNTKKLLTNNGMSFTNYIDNIPLCCPARVSMLRGQYAHNTNITGNTAPAGGFEAFYKSGQENSTVATWLQDRGYHTALYGKYLNEYPRARNIDQDDKDVSETYVPPGWSEWAVPVKGRAYAQYNYTLNENRTLVRYESEPKDYMGDVLNAKTLDFVNRQSENPYFLWLSSYSPHGPYASAERHKELFKDLKYPKTPSFNEDDVSDKPLPISVASKFDEGKSDELDKNFRQRVRSVQALDEGIAKLHESLKNSGQLDNTYIFFTSDNGYHMGEHRMGVGKHSPYEEDIKMPLIVSGPGIKAGSQNDSLVGNIDLAPTIAELSGAKIPDFVDGQSFMKQLFNKQPEKWRSHYVVQRGALNENTADARGISEPPDVSNSADDPKKLQPFTAVRGKTEIYVRYGDGQEEFYDMSSDPFQLQNLLSYNKPLTTFQERKLNELRSALERLQSCKADNCR